MFVDIDEIENAVAIVIECARRMIPNIDMSPTPPNTCGTIKYITAPSIARILGTITPENVVNFAPTKILSSELFK